MGRRVQTGASLRRHISAASAWLTDPIVRAPRRVKQVIAISIDVFLCAFTTYLVFCLRLDSLVAINYPVILSIFVSILLAVPIFIFNGLYRAIFRYSGMAGMIAVVRAVLFYAVAFALIFTTYSVHGVPRSIGLVQPMLLLVCVGGWRACVRIILGGLYKSFFNRSSVPHVLIYGAGTAGRQLAAAMINSHEMRVVGFLDDDARLHGHVLNGIPIFDPQELPTLRHKRPISDVLLAMPSATQKRRNEIIASLADMSVAVRTIPGLGDIASGKISIGDIRELEVDDLLGRDRVEPNGILLNLNTYRKTVLVTGAGGSIGSELCRQIIACSPRRLLLVEMSEHALYQIHQQLEGLAVDQDIELVPLLASAADAARMEQIIETWTPHTVYHAAAYKHVPLVEHNPAEGLRNNVWSTMVCAQLAKRFKVKNFVLVSTDKAVRPTNIMGASKRLAEMVLQALDAQQRPKMSLEHGSERTIFSMVRFGNVLGSSGSVVPLFREQIRQGGPITLTHADITRYFMTIPEAAQLVVQAGAMGTGGDVYVLDMGEPVRIYDLAVRMIELSGLAVADDGDEEGAIDILITGLRPGEKLYEELLIADNPEPTQHRRILKAHEEFMPWDALSVELSKLDAAMKDNDIFEIRRLLATLVQGYDEAGAVVDWVHLAKDQAVVADARV